MYFFCVDNSRQRHLCPSVCMYIYRMSVCLIQQLWAPNAPQSSYWNDIYVYISLRGKGKGKTGETLLYWLYKKKCHFEQKCIIRVGYRKPRKQFRTPLVPGLIGDDNTFIFCRLLCPSVRAYVGYDSKLDEFLFIIFICLESYL